MERTDLAFDDIDLMCATIRSWDLDFQPLAVMACEQTARLVQCWLPIGLLTRAQFGPPLEQAGASPAGCVTFVVQSACMRGLWWRGLDADADSVLVFPVGGELSSTSGPGFSVCTLSVHETTLREIAADLELDLPKGADWVEAFRAPRTALNEVRRSLHKVCDDERDAADEVVRHSLRSLLPHWLATASARVRSRPAPQARQRALRASLELLEDGDLGAIRPANLRVYAGVSERTLEYAFRERFGLTPAAFIKARRLARVRAALQSADPDEASVGDLMAQHHFYHVGQFAKDYRRLFGELPSVTLAARERGSVV